MFNSSDFVPYFFISFSLSAPFSWMLLWFFFLHSSYLKYIKSDYRASKQSKESLQWAFECLPYFFKKEWKKLWKDRRNCLKGDCRAIHGFSSLARFLLSNLFISDTFAQFTCNFRIILWWWWSSSSSSLLLFAFLLVFIHKLCWFYSASFHFYRRSHKNANEKLTFNCKVFSFIKATISFTNIQS